MTDSFIKKFKSSLDVIKPNSKSKFTTSFIFSIISILIGLGLGYLVMLASNPSRANEGFAQLITGGVPLGLTSIGNILFDCTPLIGVGLAVAIASKAGVFNIGGSGQYTMGGCIALIIANLLGNNVPSPLGFIICLLVGMLAGAIWAVVPALLKNHFNVNIVVSAIMMNYIAVYLSCILARNSLWYDQFKSRINIANVSNSMIPNAGLDELFAAEYNGIKINSRLDIAIIIAIVVCVLLSIIFSKTTFGLKIKTSGQNGDCAKYSGINNKLSLVYAMAISGACAGMGAVFTYLSKNPSNFTTSTTVNSMGFTGISVALIANNSPIGCIFTAILLSYIQTSGSALTSLSFDSNIIGVITSVIIYSTATVSFLSNVIIKMRNKSKEKKNINKLTRDLQTSPSNKLNEMEVKENAVK